jgi:hypothetical protein
MRRLARALARDPMIPYPHARRNPRRPTTCYDWDWTGCRAATLLRLAIFKELLYWPWNGLYAKAK